MELLNHIAIPLISSSEVHDFYENILGFTEDYRFEIDRGMADVIFGIHKPISIIVVERNGIRMELYLSGHRNNSEISHICLNESDVEGVSQRAEKAGYPVVRVNRSVSKLAFISDKSGNRFEIKQAE
jgi:methylmalonyl-CoA/ethylmalonyl-CoA epimerase